MDIVKLIVYSIYFASLIGKSHLNTTDSVTEEPSAQDFATNVSKDISTTGFSLSHISKTVSSNLISIEPSSSHSEIHSNSVLGNVSSITSNHAQEYISPTKSSSPFWAVNSTTEGSESITSFGSSSFTTSIEWNTLSNTCQRISSSSTRFTSVTSPPIDSSKISQTGFTEISNSSKFAAVNDTLQEITPNISSEHLNTLHSSFIVITSDSPSILLTERLSSSPETFSELEVFSSQVSDKSFSSDNSPATIPYSHLSTRSLSANDSQSISINSEEVNMSRADLSIAPSDNLISFENVSTAHSVLPSSTTNYFTESVYSLANISSTFLPDILPTMSSVVGDLSESIPVNTSSVISSLLAETSTSTATLVLSNASAGLLPSKTFNISRARNTASVIDDSFSSESGTNLTRIIVSTSTEHYLEISSIQSKSDIGSYRMQTISMSASEASDSVIPSYSFSSNVTIHGITKSVSISPTTTSELSFVTSDTTQITTAKYSSLTNHTTRIGIQTTARNTTIEVPESDHRVYRLVFTFDGHCEILSENDILQMEFLKALIDVVKSTANLLPHSLEAERILCEPLRVYLRTKISGLNISHLLESLEQKISSSDFIVPIIKSTHVLNFTATALEIKEISAGDNDGLEVVKSGLEVVDIVIIGIASFLFAVLLLMMVIVICRECYVRKRTTTFHLRDVPHVNLKLSEFTLTRIPRPQMFYRENSRKKHGPIPVSKLRKSQTNGHSDTKDKVKVNQDQIRVRMSKHDDGLVVGVTCSAPPSPTNNSSSCSSTPKNGDCSKISLLEGANTGTCDGVTNPSYFADEEFNGNTKIDIQEDENEQLL